MRIASKLLIAGAIAAAGTLTANNAAAQGVCGWYAIGGCFRSESDANRRSIQIDAYTLDTYDVSNFTNGWFCSVDGPYRTQRDANVVRDQFRAKGVSDAYVKKGGC